MHINIQFKTEIGIRSILITPRNACHFSIWRKFIVSNWSNVFFILASTAMIYSWNRLWLCCLYGSTAAFQKIFNCLSIQAETFACIECLTKSIRYRKFYANGRCILSTSDYLLINEVRWYFRICNWLITAVDILRKCIGCIEFLAVDSDIDFMKNKFLCKLISTIVHLTKWNISSNSNQMNFCPFVCLIEWHLVGTIACHSSVSIHFEMKNKKWTPKEINDNEGL